MVAYWNLGKTKIRHKMVPVVNGRVCSESSVFARTFNAFLFNALIVACLATALVTLRSVNTDRIPVTDIL